MSSKQAATFTGVSLLSTVDLAQQQVHNEESTICHLCDVVVNFLTLRIRLQAHILAELRKSELG